MATDSKLSISFLLGINTIPSRRVLTGLEELMKSLRKDGMLTPILVWKDYEIIDGWRRLKAAEFIGWTQVPVVIAKDYDHMLEKLTEARTGPCFVDMNWWDKSTFINNIIAPRERSSRGKIIAATRLRRRPAITERNWSPRRDATARAVGLIESTYGPVRRLVGLVEEGKIPLPTKDEAIALIDKLEREGNGVRRTTDGLSRGRLVPYTDIQRYMDLHGKDPHETPLQAQLDIMERTVPMLRTLSTELHRVMSPLSLDMTPKQASELGAALYRAERGIRQTRTLLRHRAGEDNPKARN